MADDRALKQEMFIRVCKDSGFRMEPVKAAQFSAQVLECHPLEILFALGWDNMVRIADGSHLAVMRRQGQQS